MVLLQVRLLFQFFIFFFPNKKRLPLWQPLSLNGKWLSSTIAPDCGTVKSMNIRLFKIDDQRNKSCEGCNYYSCIRRSEEHTSELQSRFDLVCRLLLEKKKNIISVTSCCLNDWCKFTFFFFVSYW